MNRAKLAMYAEEMLKADWTHDQVVQGFCDGDPYQMHGGETCISIIGSLGIRVITDESFQKHMEAAQATAAQSDPWCDHAPEDVVAILGTAHAYAQHGLLSRDEKIAFITVARVLNDRRGG